MSVNPQEESILDFLKKTDSMVDSIVVIGVTALTTTTLTFTIRKKIVKMFLENPHRRVLKEIIDLQAFTSFILQQSLDMTQNEVYSTIRILLGLGIIEKAKTMKVGAGPQTVIYIVRGGLDSRVFDAQKLHIDLMPKASVSSLGHYVDTQRVEALIRRVEQSRFKNTVKNREVIQFAKEDGKEFDYNVVKAVLKHFKARGWRVVY